MRWCTYILPLHLYSVAYLVRSWSQILPTAGAMVANQAQVFGQIIDFYTGPGQEHLPEINRLAKLNTEAADAVLLHYVMEAIRKSNPPSLSRSC
jgi:linoleate 10R-lipoxygenase